MDLWIRSQDKRYLQKIKSLCLDDNDNEERVIIYGNISDEDFELGSYATIERALEVLGEIDERIMLLNTFSIAKDRDTLLALKNALPEEKLQGLAYPYEMPKE